MLKWERELGWRLRKRKEGKGKNGNKVFVSGGGGGLKERYAVGEKRNKINHVHVQICYEGCDY